MRRSTFENNSVGSRGGGGAISLQGTSVAVASCSFHHCFEPGLEEEDTDFGGALYAASSGNTEAKLFDPK
jgi:hypothetical protein